MYLHYPWCYRCRCCVCYITSQVVDHDHRLSELHYSGFVTKFVTSKQYGQQFDETTGDARDVHFSTAARGVLGHWVGPDGLGCLPVVDDVARTTSAETERTPPHSVLRAPTQSNAAPTFFSLSVRVSEKEGERERESERKKDRTKQRRTKQTKASRG